MPTLAFVAAGFGDTLTRAEPVLGTEGPDMTRYALVCGGLVLLVVALGIGFRKLASKALGARAAKRSLAVLDVLPLGGKQRLVVVRCYDRTFALGVGEKEVSLVTELDPVIAPARESLQVAAEHKAFAATLAALEQAPAPGTLAPVRPAAAPRAVPPAAEPARPASPTPAPRSTSTPSRLAREGVLG